MKKSIYALGLTAVLSATQVSAEAIDPASVNEFQAGSPAVAAEVNANFDALISAINDNAARIAALEQGTTAPTIDMVSLAGTYRFHGHGSLYEFFDLDQDPSNGHRTHEQRDFLFAGDLTFNSDGTGQYVIENEIEMNVAFEHWNEWRFSDETEVFEGADTIPLTWTFDDQANRINLLLNDVDGEGGDENFPVDLHVSRDQNILMGAVFINEEELVDFGDPEWLRQYEIIEFTAVRKPD